MDTSTLSRIHIDVPAPKPLVAALAAAAGAEPTTTQVLAADGVDEATLHTVTLGGLTIDALPGDTGLAVAEFTVPDLADALIRLPDEAQRRATEIGASHRAAGTIVVVRTGRTAPAAEPGGARVTRILVSTPEPAGLAAALGAAAGVEVTTDPIGGTDGAVIHRMRIGATTVEAMPGADGVPAIDLVVSDLAATRDRLIAASVAVSWRDAFAVTYVGGTRLLVRQVIE
ncbi:hypothetical protein [Tsukamurella soli]